MTGFWLFIGLLGLLLCAAVLPGPLTEVVRQGIGVVIGTLHTLVQGLQRAHAQTLNFWRQQFGEFSVRPFLGSLLLVSAAGVLAWAEFGLLIPTWASLLATGEELAAGLPGSPALLTTIGLFVVEALMGFFLFEVAGVTDFMHWDERLSKKMRWAFIGLCLGILWLLAVVQAGLAIWRTEQITQMRQADELLSGWIGAGEAGAWVVSTPPSSWLDRMTPWFPGVVAFLFPVTAAAAAVGLYPLLMNLTALAVAIGGLLPLTLLLALATLVLNMASYMGSFLEALLNLVTGAGRLLAERVRGQQGQQERGTPQPVSPVETVRPPQPPSPPPEPIRADQGQLLPTSDGQEPAQGLDAVIEALNANPLGVEEELVTQVLGRDEGTHVRFRPGRPSSRDGGTP